jgi:hypothetical protein
MTTLRRILITAVATAAVSSIASADIIVGYQTTIGPTTTDLVNASTSALPSWNPGDANSMLSNISGNGYTTGISMASLTAPLTNYILEGFNISVKETLTGNYSITNNSTNSTANGSANIDTYAAVALNGALSPALTNTADPANDLFNCSATGTGLPSTSCTPGEQATSTGGGPDPNSPESSTFNITPGGTFNSGTINVNSKWVDYGCEIINQQFCNEITANDAAGNLLTSGLSLVNGPPDLTFDISTVTETTTTVTGGNLHSTYNTLVTEQVEVTYDYIALSGAPEPGTMALLGGALIGLGLIGKRFKKN